MNKTDKNFFQTDFILSVFVPRQKFLISFYLKDESQVPLPEKRGLENELIPFSYDKCHII